MPSKNKGAYKMAKKFAPIALVFTVQQLNQAEAAQVDTESHIQEIADLVSSALTESGEGSEANNALGSLSNTEINAQIHETIKEAIKIQKQDSHPNSKLGFLQKVVTLDCFFGGSDCLFKDKKSMIAGKVTEYAKKQFEDGNQDVNQYLAQVKEQINVDMNTSAAIKSIDKLQEKSQPQMHESNIQLQADSETEEQNKERVLNKQLHDSVQGLISLNKKEKSDSQRPKTSNLVNAKATEQDANDLKSQLVTVPIDEVNAIGLKISPTYGLDTVNSVTLKSFRKIIGYDTFNSILKENRNESKDLNDYYNVTVSMMIQRVPESKIDYEELKMADGKTLAASLDKGFPYDDSNIATSNLESISTLTVKDVVQQMQGKNITKQSLVQLAGPQYVQLDEQKSDKDGMFAFGGENVTRGNLKNLIVDKPSPITVALAQKSDKDGMFAFGGENVTRGNLKNLIVDKPSPITVALAQKSDKDGMFAFGGENVTRGNLKNLIVDKPSPITVALAQKSDKDGMFAFGGENVTRGNLKNLIVDKPSPITVALAQKSDSDGMFAFGGENVTRGNLKNLIVDKPSPITVALAQKSDSDGMFAFGGENVTRGNLKNLIVDKPSPITVALAQKSDKDGMFAFGGENVTRGNLKNLIVDKPSPITVALAQKSPVVNHLLQLENQGVPVLVNPESSLRTDTMADHKLGPGFGQIRVGIDELKNLVQKPQDHSHLQLNATNPVNNPPYNNWSVNQPSHPHDSGMSGHEDLGMRDIIIDGVNYDVLQLKSDNGKVQKSSKKDLKLAQVSVMPVDDDQNEPGNFAIQERDPAHSAENLVQIKGEAKYIPLSDEQNQPGNLLIQERDTSSPLNLAQVSSKDKIMPLDSELNQPGSLAVVDRDANNDPKLLAQVSHKSMVQKKLNH